MRYKKEEIGKYVTLRQGFAINKNTNHHMSEEKTNLHLLRIGDMKDNSYSIYVKDTIPENFIAGEEDIIYTRTGQVGLVFKKKYGVVHNNCFTVTSNDENVLCREYLYYALQLKEFYEEANSRASGAAQPDLPHGSFNSIKIFLPDIKSQRKIGEILSVYDDLIENNQKQIKLLEEVAQRLYKEWFVDLRFPGYEDIEIIDGIPKGWEMNSLGEIAVLKAGGDKPSSFSKECNSKCNVPVYSNGTKNEGLYGYTDVPVIFENCVTISARGSVGYACLRRVPFVPIVRLISVIPKKVDLIYLYLYLKNFKFESNGAAQQQITVPMIKNKMILLPEKKIQEKFLQIIVPLQDSIDNCKKQIKKLIEARDRLLPKLMDGEIEV